MQYGNENEYLNLVNYRRDKYMQQAHQHRLARLTQSRKARTSFFYARILVHAGEVLVKLGSALHQRSGTLTLPEVDRKAMSRP